MARLLISEHHRHQVQVLRGKDAVPASLPDAGLRRPSGLALHPDGLLVVADTDSNRLALWDLFGSAWSYLGTGPGAGEWEFERPTAVACGSGGHIYVADSGNGRIVRLAPDASAWAAVGSLGRPTPGDPGAFLFADPRGLAVAPTGGIVVADPGNRRLVRFPATAFDDAAAGGEGLGAGWVVLPIPDGASPARPFGACAFAGGLAVTDVGNRAVHALADDGTPVASFTAEMQPLMAVPAYVAAVDDSHLAVADPSGNSIRILRLDADTLVEEAVIRGSDPTQPRPLFSAIGGLTSGRV